MAKASKKSASKKTASKRTTPKPAAPKAASTKNVKSAKPAGKPRRAAAVEAAPAVESKQGAPAAAKAASPTAQDKALAFAIEAARLASDDKCTNVMLLDVRGLSQIADFILIASGTSDRQMRSVLDHIDELGGKTGFSMLRSNTDERATWLLADFVDVIVHLFEPNTRAHYDLEMMWGDAPRVEWERPEGSNPRRRKAVAAENA
jgi:ribosome-associated protein